VQRTAQSEQHRASGKAADFVVEPFDEPANFRGLGISKNFVFLSQKTIEGIPWGSRKKADFVGGPVRRPNKLLWTGYRGLAFVFIATKQTPELEWKKLKGEFCREIREGLCKIGQGKDSFRKPQNQSFSRIRG
jgi:hypothetical protein